MSKLGKSFYEEYSDEFEEYLARFVSGLKSSNQKYLSLINKIEGVKKDFPRVREVLENNMIHELTKDEVGAVIEINALNIELQSVVYKELFFKGGNEGFRYMKLVGVL